jgi:hypothetical protein
MDEFDGADEVGAVGGAGKAGEASLTHLGMPIRPYHGLGKPSQHASLAITSRYTYYQSCSMASIVLVLHSRNRRVSLQNGSRIEAE